MKRPSASHVDPVEMSRRLAAIAAKDRESSERARDTRAKVVQAVRASRAMRLSQIEADQANLRAALAGLEYRLSVHDAEIDELLARVARLKGPRAGAP